MDAMDGYTELGFLPPVTAVLSEDVSEALRLRAIASDRAEWYRVIEENRARGGRPPPEHLNIYWRRGDKRFGQRNSRVSSTGAMELSNTA